MQSTFFFDGATSDAFPVSSGVKQGCVLAPTLFGIFFLMLLHYAFAYCSESVYIRTRPDGKLFNIARVRAKTKTLKVLLHELLFADDAALASHTEAGLQCLVAWLSEKTKLQVYRSCVLSTLLYGSESWPTYARQEKQLNGVHLRCLWRLLQIKWQDRVSNTYVLQRADMPSIPALLIQRRLR